jgi:hypothetical protein
LLEFLTDQFTFSDSLPRHSSSHRSQHLAWHHLNPKLPQFWQVQQRRRDGEGDVCTYDDDEEKDGLIVCTDVWNS